MAEYRDWPQRDEGLAGLRDMARALNDDELEDRMEAARVALRKSTEEINYHAAKLTESVQELAGGTVTRIHQEPTAEVALTEDELRSALKVSRQYWVSINAIPPVWHQKLEQALKIESGPGGRFDGDTAA